MAVRRLQDDIAETLRAARRAERDIFGALHEEVLLAPGPDGGWTPKDVQAHLTSWKARQAQRHAAARRGEEIEPEIEKIDEINAQFHAARVGWSWGDVVAEADQVTDQLVDEIQGTDLPTLLGNERLLGGSIGNGGHHTLEHLPPLARAHGMEPRVLAYAHELEEIVLASDFPDRDKGTFIYNQACFRALAGRLDEARALLPKAFAMRPDLAEFAQQDSDLEPLRDELAALAAR